jgi:hypothetical protein
MKKLSRFFRFSLKAFLIFVLATAAVFAWLGNAHLEHRRELVAIAEIQNTVSGSNTLFETVYRQNTTPPALVLR